MSAEMDDPLDKTTLATISLLESRLLRIEHLLYGTTASPTSSINHHDAALEKIDILERRFNNMVAQIRVYAELLKICQFLQLQPAGSLISKFQFLISTFLAQTSRIQISSMLHRLLSLHLSSTRKQSSPLSSPQHRHSPLRSPPSPPPKISPSPTLLLVPLSYL